MSQSDDDRLTEAFSAVADGRAVDWTTLLAATSDDRERGLIAQLQVLEQVRSGGGPESIDPRIWGRLEVLDELGRGAYGRVFRARDPRLDREVALKLFDGQAVAEGRFLREAQILARNRHPHVVAVHGANACDGLRDRRMDLGRC